MNDLFETRDTNSLHAGLSGANHKQIRDDHDYPVVLGFNKHGDDNKANNCFS